MSEEQNPFWLVGRATLGTGAQVTITKNPDAPILSVLPSPLEAIESARKQARAELRDRFATAALTGLLAYPHGVAMPEQIAKRAWDFADAMLKARGDE
jgi:hypothetical protein